MKYYTISTNRIMRAIGRLILSAIMCAFFFSMISCEDEKITPQLPPIPPPPPPEVIEEPLVITPTLKAIGYSGIENRIGGGDIEKDSIFVINNLPDGTWKYILNIEDYEETGEFEINQSYVKLANMLRDDKWFSYCGNDSIEVKIYFSSEELKIDSHLVVIKLYSDIYAIHTWQDIQAMQYDLKGNYYLTKDISFPERATGGFSEQGFIPIGSGGPEAAFTLNAFKGSFNGYGYSIKGLFIDRTGNNYVGLFGILGGAAKIKDLNIELIDSSKVGVKGGNYVGGIAGYAAENCVIENCKITGCVYGTNYVGGIAGYIEKNSMVKLCRATGQVSGGVYVGGIVGYSEEGSMLSTSFSESNIDAKNYVGGLTGLNKGSIYNCQVGGTDSITTINGIDYVGGIAGWNSGELLGNRLINNTITGDNKVGGLLGYAEESSICRECCAKISIKAKVQVGGLIGCNKGAIYDSYVIGDIQGSSVVGGLVGEFHKLVINSYASVKISNTTGLKGGFLGSNAGTATNCYWNTTAGGATISVGSGSSWGIIEKSEANFTTFDGTQMPRSIFVGWDFSEIWENEVLISYNDDFPGLKREFNFE